MPAGQRRDPVRQFHPEKPKRDRPLWTDRWVCFLGIPSLRRLILKDKMVATASMDFVQLGDVKIIYPQEGGELQLSASRLFVPLASLLPLVGLLQGRRQVRHASKHVSRPAS